MSTSNTNNSYKRSNKSKRRNPRKLQNLGRAVNNDQQAISNLKRQNNPRRRGRAQSSQVGNRRDPKPAYYANANNAMLGTLNNKLMRSYCQQYFDYLATLAHPWTITNAVIPDWTTFPRGVAQIRTVGVITTGTTSADDTFMMTLLPCLLKSGNFVVNGGSGTTSYITINGIKYGPNQPTTIFSVHNLASWQSVLDSYRIISMGVKVKYIGQVLNTAGQISTAVKPPEAGVATTFDELSDYNYSYVGGAKDGATQVWLVAGMNSFNMTDIGNTVGTEDESFLQVSAKGLPLNSAVFQIEWVMNIETYSTDQILTANNRAGKPDSNKMSVATQAMASAHAAGQLSGPVNAATSIAKGVLNVGSKIAAPYLKQAVESAGDNQFYSYLAKGASALVDNIDTVESVAMAIGSLM